MSSGIELYRNEQELLQLELKLERTEWCLNVAVNTLAEISKWDSVDVYDLRREAQRVLDWVEGVMDKRTANKGFGAT